MLQRELQLHEGAAHRVLLVTAGHHAELWRAKHLSQTVCTQPGAF
jgi:hypothetical protein